MVKPYRKNVAALIKQVDAFLLCERINPPGAWQLVQGGIEDGEDVEDALMRELSEELGVDDLSVFRFVAAAPSKRYEFPAGVEWTIARHYAGQDQVVCLIDFLGDDQMFDLTRDDPPEFSNFEWVSTEAVVERTWALKRPIVEAAFAYFRSQALITNR